MLGNELDVHSQQIASTASQPDKMPKRTAAASLSELNYLIIFIKICFSLCFSIPNERFAANDFLRMTISRPLFDNVSPATYISVVASH